MDVLSCDVDNDLYATFKIKEINKATYGENEKRLFFVLSWLSKTQGRSQQQAHRKVFVLEWIGWGGQFMKSATAVTSLGKEAPISVYLFASSALTSLPSSLDCKGDGINN